ncbi:RNA polymerase sigma-70 factor [Reichenbachiella sp. MALMAid0571]|uniref:RNA polymerase sigma-70 factor n=1 Tax=Reichenbachiella sp. MALMAid0571 TaxID=3143939 RepID=UPI0032DF5415
MKADSFNIESIQHRISKSDEPAFRLLFNHFYARLLNYAFVIVKNHESAEDIVLEVMHTVWERRSKLHEVKNLANYLYVCTRNKTLDYHQKNSKLMGISFDDPHYNEFVVHHNPELHLIHKELFDFIDQAILSLPEKTRLVYRMVKEEGMKYQEVADLLGISVKTVNNQVLSSMKTIRQQATLYLNKDKKNPLFRTMLSFLFF